MNKKKVFVLGAGRGQIPLIRLFQKYGCSVTAVSYKGNFPGFDVADEKLFLDIRDKDAILECARKENICGIATDQVDQSVPTAAYVSEKLGIPGITYDVSLKFTNKYIMRQEAEKAGILVPYYAAVTSLSQAEAKIAQEPSLCFPIVVKPVDSAGSKGVAKVCSMAELGDAFLAAKENSATGEVLLEQFISGREYAVESFTRGGETTVLTVGHRDYFDIPGVFIPAATLFSDAVSANSGIEERIKQTTRTLVSAFGLPFGITHAEYLHDERTDNLYLVEIAARGGGVFISSDLIPAACGVNANELLVREVLQIQEKLPILLQRGASAYFCYLTPVGIVEKIEGVENVHRIPGVVRAFFDNIAIGQETKSIRDKYSRKGPILVRGESKEECYRICDRVKAALDIKVKTPDGFADILWS